MTEIQRHEEALDSFDAEVRREALEALAQKAERGEIALPEPGDAVNLHGHTFFSFNGYGYSPSRFAWKARREGLRMAGTVDFDVLDAVDEFRAAARRLRLKACSGIETRVYLPEFASREINSPGEPGISYHMGSGFVSSSVKNEAFLRSMKESAQARNRAIVGRVNPYLAPVELDYERDVLPLTPRGNATERHLCAAYEEKAREVFPDEDARIAFWAERLREEPEKVREGAKHSPTFQALIRGKLMKRGGVGYVQPEGPDFPRLAEVNDFVRGEGAIPTLAWLDGTTAGEAALDELLDLQQAHGTAAVNIIPDRNWNIKDPEQKKVKVENLHRFVKVAQERGLPIIVGTEMNAYGQPFVDNFDVPEMRPLLPAFLEGAHILYAHTVLQEKAGLGYLSPWAESHFPDVKARNRFYADFGERLRPEAADGLEVGASDVPEGLLERLG